MDSKKENNLIKYAISKDIQRMYIVTHKPIFDRVHDFEREDYCCYWNLLIVRGEITNQASYSAPLEIPDYEYIPDIKLLTILYGVNILSNDSDILN